MYDDTIDGFVKAANAKLDLLRRAPHGFFVGCMLAGAYIGLGIILIFSLGSHVPPDLRPLVMGATFGIPLVRCDLMACIAWADALSVAIVGTSDRAATDYATHRYEDRFVLLMASERQGLPASLEAIAETMVRIPMAGQADSLNLAIATSLVLYEARNQRVRRVPDTR